VEYSLYVFINNSHCAVCSYLAVVHNCLQTDKISGKRASFWTNTCIYCSLGSVAYSIVNLEPDL